MNDNTLVIAENGVDFVYNSGHSRHSDLRDLDTKIITIVFARTSDITISELIELVRKAPVGMQMSFIDSKHVLKAVSFLIKHKYIRYAVLPELNISVEDGKIGSKAKRYKGSTK